MKVSVIIPVYNAEKYIIRCINSLLLQSLKDLEVIIVDDHGKDESIALIKKYIETNERKNMFRFAETEVNSGPGAARNVGLQMAQGEFVAFLDSDDWVEPAMYEELYDKAVQYVADICYCNIQQEDVSYKTIRIIKNLQTEQGIFTQKEKRKFLVNYLAYCWSYIYRRDFLQQNRILFPPEKSAEDSYFVACCILCAKSIARVDKILYHYSYIDTSLSQRKNDKRYLDKLSVFKRLIQFAKTKGIYDDYADELQFIYLKKAFITGSLNYLNNAIKPQTKTLKELYHELVTIIPNYNNNIYYKSSFNARLLVLLLKKMPCFAVSILPFFFFLSQSHKQSLQ